MPSRPKVTSQAHRDLPTTPSTTEQQHGPGSAKPQTGGGGNIHDTVSSSSSSSDIGAHLDADEAHKRTLLRRVFVHYSKPLHTPGATSKKEHWKPPASVHHDEQDHHQQLESEARHRPRMTNWHFIMACRDSGLLQSADVTRTDCDLVFSKIKDSHNMLTPKRFRLALEMLAERANKPVDEIVGPVVKYAEGLPHEPHHDAPHGRGSPPAPSASSTSTHGSAHQARPHSEQKRQQHHHTDDELPATFRRLTDPHLYTGSHWYRFDEAGTGKGLAGRASTPKGEGIPASTTKQFETGMRSESDVRGVPFSSAKSRP